MSARLTELPVKGTTLISAGGIAAKQLESFLARQHLAVGRTAWLGPTVLTYRDWAAALWRRYLDDGHLQLLGPGQTDALWRRVIDDSGADMQGLPGYRHVSAWAREASQRRREWNIDPDELRGFVDDPDCRAFVRWEQAYREELQESGWLDSADAVDALVARPPQPRADEPASLVWTDLALSPLQSRLTERLQQSGFRCSEWQPPNRNRRCRRVQLPETADEIRSAAAWAAARIADQPRQRVAVVVPGLETRRDEIVAVLEEALNPELARLGTHAGCEKVVCLQGQSAALDNPVMGAALNALELFSGAGDFRVLSRWLRSPFFAAPDNADARCMLETELRSHLASQMDFVDAFRSGGLAARIEAAVPALADELRAAVALLDAQPGRQTLTGWASVWRRLLDELGWCSNDLALPEDWESALNDLMLLTPILGRLSQSDALAELQNVLARPQRLDAVPLNGVFLLSDPEEVGPGYDAAWVCGLTDTQWPRAPQPVPLLPLALQRSRRMPSATPAASLEQSRIALRRLVERVPDLVLSSPEVVHDHSAQPSPLILSHPLVTEADLVGGPVRRLQSETADESRLETRADPVPPIANRCIKGGIGTLSLHAVCPLRAFIESRLQAKPLETVQPGFSARQRGIAAHAALRRLYSERPDQQEVRSWDAAERSRRVERSCYLSLRAMFGESQPGLAVLFALELARLRSMVNNFLELEVARTAFRVSAVEQSVRIEAGGLELSGRIDRVDELGPHGALAVIDYKTGTRFSPGDWFKARPRDLQLPGYALSLEGDVEAVVIAILNPQGSAYKGFWPGGGRFPGRPARLSGELTWPLQRERWRAQLDELALEFAGGDGRIFRADLRLAEGAVAPLTRIHESTRPSGMAASQARVGGPSHE